MNISLQNLSKSYGARELFSDFSLEIASGTRLCVVGANGTGKSTLLRLLAGDMDPDSGRVIIPRDARLGYVAQETLPQEMGKPLLAWVLEVLPSWSAFWTDWEAAAQSGNESALKSLAGRQADLEILFGYNPEHRAKSVLSGLGFREDQFDQPLSALSGGWRERAKLARVLTAGADVLLLDEPTNHLDLEAVEWLEAFLLEYQGILVFVAHDRVFMDRVATHVLFLGAGRPYYRKGGFSNFLEWYEEMDVQREREAKRLADEIGKKMDFVRRFKAKATKARQAASKKKQALRMEKDLEGLAPEPKRRELSFRWPEPARSEKTVLSVVDLEFHHEGKTPLWPPLNFNIFRGQKIAVIGPHGCGKSTLLKLIVGKLAPDSGHVALSTLTRRGYFSQHQAELLDPERPPLSEIRRRSDPRMTEEELMSVLGLFMLGENYFDRPVAKLSGGEKSRLLLAGLFLARANFLVLDEPTNHLDLESREALIQALEDYPGTILLVAHDRWLLSRVAQEAWALSPKGFVIHKDGFAGYELARREAALAASAAPAAQAVNREEQKRLKRDQAERRNALYKEIKPRQDEYVKLESRLDSLSGRLAELETLLSDPATYQDARRMAELNKDYRHSQEESEEILERMALLEEEIQSLENQRSALSS